MKKWMTFVGIMMVTIMLTLAPGRKPAMAQAASPVLAETALPSMDAGLATAGEVAPAEKAEKPDLFQQITSYLGVASAIFLALWPIARLFVTNRATRAALDAWAETIQKLKIADRADTKTINDLLSELKKLETKIPKEVLAQWKGATARAKRIG